jgi:putative addiction module killer protein
MATTKNYKFYLTPEYQDWLEKESKKAQVQIETRLSNIILHRHFGDHKFLSDDIWELRWLNGRRLYYAYLAELNIVILLGGNKNGQSKDITKAKKIFKKYNENE